jgi:hypothetical protein
MFGNRMFVTEGYKKADFWVRDLDKSDLMIQKDLHCIIDWKVLWFGKAPEKTKKVKKEDKIKEIVDSIFVGENAKQIKIDFAACYSRMNKDIKNLTVDQQVRIVMSSMSIGYTSSTVVLDKIIEGYKEDEPKQAIE